MYEELIAIISKRVSRELTQNCTNSLLRCLGIINRHARHVVNMYFYERIYKLGIYSPSRKLALRAGKRLVKDLNQTVTANIEAMNQFDLFRKHLVRSDVMPLLGQAIPRLISDYSPKNIPVERVAELSTTLRQVGIWKYQLLALLNIPLFEKDTILRDLKEGERLFYAFDNLTNLTNLYLKEFRDTIMSEEAVPPFQVFEEGKRMDSFYSREVGGESSSNPGFLDILGRIIQGIGGGFLVSGDVTVAALAAPLSGPAALGAVTTIGGGIGLIGHAFRTSG